MEYWCPPILSGRKKKLYRVRKDTIEENYRSLYRFDEQNVQWISDHFLGTEWERRGGGLSPKCQMQVFLRYMADPGFQIGVGEDLGINQTTVSKTLHAVKEKILKKSDVWVKFPSTSEQIHIAKTEWAEKYKMPTCIGMLDCTHVRIPKPSVQGDEYINRKGFPSINVQCTVDALERFTSVDAQWPGSVHDSRIFRNSAVKSIMERTVNTILLADSGYGIAPYLLTPYDRPRAPEEVYFNQIYAKERVTVERCFGQMKMRFPILHYKVRTKLSSVGQIILCCCILHNIAKYLGDDVDFPELDEDDVFEEIQEENASTSNSAKRRLGQQKRNEIAHVLFQNK